MQFELKFCPHAFIVVTIVTVVTVVIVVVVTAVLVVGILLFSAVCQCAIGSM